jgi:hypothetical protein
MNQEKLPDGVERTDSAMAPPRDGGDAAHQKPANSTNAQYHAFLDICLILPTGHGANNRPVMTSRDEYVELSSVRRW